MSDACCQQEDHIKTPSPPLANNPFDKIPQEVKGYPQWVLWKWVVKDGNKTKVPISPKNPAQKASVSDSNTWSNYETALVAYNAWKDHDIEGIGFVFTADDPFVGIDFDHVRDAETGDWQEGILEEILSFKSYAETSQSGTGAHVILKGSPLNRRCGKREIYSSGRYFIMTGHHIESTPLSIVSNPSVVSEFCERYNLKDDVPSIPPTRRVAPEFSDNEILSRCHSARNAEKFARLWSGNHQGYQSGSEADLALCGILATHTDDYDQIDRLFRRSGLFRTKWDEKRGEFTYGKSTIRKVLASHVRSDHMFSLTDAGNGERFVVKYGEDIRYCHTFKAWFIWNGKIWQRDDSNQIMVKATDVVRSIYAEATHAPTDNERRDIASWAKSSENLTLRKHMIESAAPLIAVKTSELDAKGNLYNCVNGTIELDTVSFREHRREDMLTKCSGVVYDPSAECPHWIGHLKRIFRSEESFIEDFQVYCGYTLISGNPEQIMFILWGTGANGKSTTVNALHRIWGDYATTVAFTSLMVKNNDTPRCDLARIAGARVVISNEGEIGDRLSESWIKQMTGGDTLTVRRLYEGEFEFKPECVIWFVTNHLPNIKGADNAIWRRIWCLPFVEQIQENERDTNIDEKLAAESSGILNWCLEGLKRYYQLKNLPMHDIIKKANQEYREESDIIGDFISEHLVFDGLESTSRTEVYTTYKFWAEENGMKPISTQAFTRCLREKGIRDGGKVGGIRCWSGIRLKNSHEWSHEYQR